MYPDCAPTPFISVVWRIQWGGSCRAPKSKSRRSRPIHSPRAAASRGTRPRDPPELAEQTFATAIWWHIELHLPAPRLLAAATTFRASPAARGENNGPKAREDVQHRRRGGPRRRDVAHSAVITGERLSHHRMSHRRCPAQEQDTLSGATDAPPNKRLRRPPATPA